MWDPLSAKPGLAMELQNKPKLAVADIHRFDGVDTELGSKRKARVQYIV